MKGICMSQDLYSSIERPCDNANQFILGKTGKGMEFVLKKEDFINTKTSDDVINNILKRTCKKRRSKNECHDTLNTRTDRERCTA